MDPLLYKSISLDVKSLKEDGEFEGFGSTFGNEDLGGDIVMSGAFSDSLKAHTKNGTLPSMLLEHDPKAKIGDFMTMEETSKGLKVSGKLWIDGTHPDPDALKAYRAMKGTATRGLSIGFRTKVSDLDPKGRRLIKVADLQEVSFTSFPMNPKATVVRVKSLVQPDGSLVDIRTAEAILREAGLSKQQAKALLAVGFKGLQRRDAELAEQTDSIIGMLQNLKNAYKA